MSGTRRRAHLDLGPIALPAFLVTVVPALVGLSAAEPPVLEWETSFGGPGTNESGADVLETADGDLVAAGWSFAPGFSAIVVRTDAGGRKIWERSYAGGTAQAIDQTADGGFVLAGSRAGDVFLIRIDPDGELRWQRTFGGPGHEAARSIVATHDGGVVVTGSGDGDVLLLKTDGDGNLLWDRRLGSGLSEEAASLIETRDGGFLVAGSRSFDYLDRDVYVLEADADGNVVRDWAPPSPGRYAVATGICGASGGGFVISGWSGVPDGYGFADVTAFLIRAERPGRTIWERAYPGKGGFNTRANSVEETGRGGFFVAGGKSPSGSRGWDSYLFETDVNGVIHWELSTIEGGPVRTAAGSSFAGRSTRDGGFVVTGHETRGVNDGYLAKLSAPGEGPGNPEAVPFRRGDANGDGGIDVSDAVFTLLYLFAGGTRPDCADAADSDDSGALDLSDAIALFGYLFLDREEPPVPGTACGVDATRDATPCLEYGACGA